MLFAVQVEHRDQQTVCPERPGVARTLTEVQTAGRVHARQGQHQIVLVLRAHPADVRLLARIYPPRRDDTLGLDSCGWHDRRIRVLHGGRDLGGRLEAFGNPPVEILVHGDVERCVRVDHVGQCRGLGSGVG